MFTKIEVESRKEADLIRRGLEDPGTRAIVKIMGALAGQTAPAKARILRFVKDHFDERDPQ